MLYFGQLVPPVSISPSGPGANRKGDSPIRVLHVFGVMNRGGAELRTLDIMRKIPPTRVRQEFCVLTGRPGTLDDEIRALGGDVHMCRLDATFPARFAALLRRREIEIVHSHVQLASGFILSIARAAGVRHRIAHFRSTGDDRGHSVARQLYRGVMRQLISRFATNILACGEGVMTEGWSPRWRSDDRCQVIYNGVDAHLFETEIVTDVRGELGLAQDTMLVLMVGRFDPPKNHGRAADVFAAVAARCNAHLLLAGRDTTPEGVAFRKRVDALGLTGLVHVLGERDDVPCLLRASDVLLLTSVREGMPGGVLEAVAAGTPVVASALPGVLEISSVLPGVMAVPLSRDDAVWADAVMAQLEQRPTEVSRAAARSRFRKSPFSVDIAAEAHVRVWQRARS